MMTFNDIKAFIDFASDPKKYKDVVDQMDERQKKWEALVETYTKVEDAAKYVASSHAVVGAAKAELDEAKQAFEKEKTSATEKLEAAKLKVKAAQEKTDVLKTELEEKTSALTISLTNAKKIEAELEAQKLLLSEQQSAIELLAAEHKEKLDKLNAVLKQM